MMEELSENFLQGRSAVYEFLFRAFYKVTDNEFLSYGKKFVGIALEMAKESGSPLMKEGSDMLASFFASDALKDENCLLELNAAYTKLFVIGRRPKDRERAQRVKEKSPEEIVLSVTNYFADSNIIKPDIINMPVDSFAMELFYMFKTAYPFDRKQISFMENHLSKWNSNYLKELSDNCGNNIYGIFYGGIIRFCEGFLAEDYEWLKSLEGNNN